MSSIKPFQRSQKPAKAPQTPSKHPRAESNSLLAGIGAGRTPKSAGTDMRQELDRLSSVYTHPQAGTTKDGNKPQAPHQAKKSGKSQEHAQEYLLIHRPWSDAKRRVEPKKGAWLPMGRWEREEVRDQAWNVVAVLKGDCRQGRSRIDERTRVTKTASSVGAEKGSSCRSNDLGR